MCIWNDNRLLLFLSFFLDMFLITLNFSVRLPTTVLVSSLASPTVNQQSTTTLQTKKQQQPIYYNQTIKINKRHYQLLSRCVDLIYYCHRRSPLPSITAVCVCACASNHADDDADTLSLARSHSHPQNRYRPFRWHTKPPRATLWSAAREIRTVTIWSTAGQDHHLYQAKIKNKDKPCQIRSVKPHVKSFVYQLCWQVAMFFFCSVSSSSFPLRLVCFYRHRHEKKIAASIVLSLSLYLSSCWSKIRWCLVVVRFWLAYFSFSKCRFLFFVIGFFLWHVSKMKQRFPDSGAGIEAGREQISDLHGLLVA